MIQNPMSVTKKRLFPGLIAALLITLLAACAPGREFVRNGNEMIRQGDIKQGLAELEKALQAEPDNREYRLLLIRQREIQVSGLLTRADAERNADRLDEAASLYQRATEIDTANTRARDGFIAVETARRYRQRTQEAQTLLAQGKNDEASQKLRMVLSENPNYPAALSLKRRMDEQSAANIPSNGLRPKLRKPVTLEFRDATIKAVFEALSRSTSINFVFDRDVRPDIKVTLFMNNITVEDAIGVLTITNQLGYKLLSDNTVLIYPNTPAKQKDYLELMVKTFYLANAEAKQMFTMLKTVLKTKDLYADEKLNSLTMRDTPDAVHLAERLIAAQDLAEPEVVLDVEVLEVKRSRLTQLGVDLPGQFTVLNLVQNPATVVSTATGATTVVNNTLTTTQLTIDKLRGVNGSSIGINNPTVNARTETGDTNILANPRIRVKNRDKARVLIGDRVPVITTTSTANVGVSESVNYLDVGLKLDVEPNVFLNDEVGIKVGLEVSNIVKEVRSKSGTLTYQIGTRAATTNLRLRDGETQALAGLISDEDRSSAGGVPGLIDLPLLGRLFSSQTSDRNKTEIVLLITPRIVRNLSNPNAVSYEYTSGTETAVGASPLKLRGEGKLVISPARAGNAAQSAEPQPQPEPLSSEQIQPQQAQPETEAQGKTVPATPGFIQPFSPPLPATSSAPPGPQ